MRYFAIFLASVLAWLQRSNAVEYTNYKKALQLEKKKKYTEAASYFLKAIQAVGEAEVASDAMMRFISMHQFLDQEYYAYIELSEMYKKHNQIDNAKLLIDKALQLNQKSAVAQVLAAELWLSEASRKSSSESEIRPRLAHLQSAFQYAGKDADVRIIFVVCCV